MKTIRCRLRLLSRVLRLPGRGLAEADEMLADVAMFYGRPPTTTEDFVKLKSVKARYGKAFVRPEFPIMPDEYIEIAPTERKTDG